MLLDLLLFVLHVYMPVYWCIIFYGVTYTLCGYVFVLCTIRLALGVQFETPFPSTSPPINLNKLMSFSYATPYTFLLHV